MATLRQFLVDQSTVPQGSTVREHLENPGSGGTGPGETVFVAEVLVVLDQSPIEVEVADVVPVEVEVATPQAIEVFITATGIQVEIDQQSLTGEL
jgi:hypothetical protein